MTALPPPLHQLMMLRPTHCPILMPIHGANRRTLHEKNNQQPPSLVSRHANRLSGYHMRHLLFKDAHFHYGEESLRFHFELVCAFMIKCKCRSLWFHSLHHMLALLVGVSMRVTCQPDDNMNCALIWLFWEGYSMHYRRNAFIYKLAIARFCNEKETHR